MERNTCWIYTDGLKKQCVTDNSRPVFSLRCYLSSVFDVWDISIVELNGGLVWRRCGIPATQTHIRYEGDMLCPKTEYLVRAVLRQNGKPVGKARSVFETGFLGTPWLAQWIEPEQESAILEKELPFFAHFMPNPEFLGGHTRLHPCQEIRRDFVISELPRKARIYASAHGIYELSINGKRVSDRWLAPETSTYQKRLYYQTYDVTSLLCVGENTIEAVLADGWWIGRIGLSGDSCQYGDRLGFIMQAELTYKDGSVNKICSGEQFECRRSNISYADLFIGQRCDFARKPERWSPNCSTVEYQRNNLVAQPVNPIVEHSVFEPTFFNTPRGELIADFGQCMAGVVDITVCAPQGKVVTLDFTETLDAQGNYFRNIIGRNKDQRDVFVCGKHETRFEPRFTYHGFRYVHVSGICREQIVSMKARAIGTPISQRGEFDCSDERLNKLQHCIRWSMQSNMVSVPTDCPQREKLGWTGDILTFAPTGCFNYNLENFLSAWLANMREEQIEDGAVPITVPNSPMQEKFQVQVNGENTSSAWSDACVMVPWTLYQQYGGIQVLRDNFDMMTRWLEYVKQRCKERPDEFETLPEIQQKHNDYLWNKGYHFGDWFVPSLVREEGGVQKATAQTRDVIGSSFFVLTIQTYLNVIDTLLDENPENAVLIDKKGCYSKLLERVKTAVRECFISDDGHIHNDLQGLYVIVLYAGIVEGELKEKLVRRLAKLIEQNDSCLDTGFVTVPYLLDVLSGNGYHDLALKLLFQTKSPSWLYMVENGATTIWENWEAIREDGSVTTSSMNHYALGSVGDWIYRNIGGIQNAGVGYKHVDIAPDIYCGLKYASCSVRNSYGKISCNWEWRESVCEIHISIPPNTTCEFEDELLTAGVYTFRKTRNE